MPFDSALFSSDRWTRALESFADATQLTVKLFDADVRAVFGPIHVTPLFKLFENTTGYDPGIFAECARRCLAQTNDRPAVIVAEYCGLSVVGTSLALQGEIVGAVVGGYALVDFSQSWEIQRLALDSGVMFELLWRVVREQRPVPQRRLMLNGELLQVLGDALLLEGYRNWQYEEA
jgi:PocR sensory domain-containing protein